MLYCTLSANLNGLNLGTQELALNAASFTNVGSNPNFRHADPRMRKHSMRNAVRNSIGDDSIKRLIPKDLPAFSPLSSAFWPSQGARAAARRECVLASFATSTTADSVDRVSRGFWPVLSQVPPTGCPRVGRTMTPAEPFPVATTATGG
jgi:hypothetical protein